MYISAHLLGWSVKCRKVHRRAMAAAAIVCKNFFTKTEQMIIFFVPRNREFGMTWVNDDTIHILGWTIVEQSSSNSSGKTTACSSQNSFLFLPQKAYGCMSKRQVWYVSGIGTFSACCSVKNKEKKKHLQTFKGFLCLQILCEVAMSHKSHTEICWLDDLLLLFYGFGSVQKCRIRC